MRLLGVFLAAVGFALSADVSQDWIGKPQRCTNSGELLKTNHLRLGVRIDNSNRVLVRQFERALNFWATVVDMRWYRDDDATCSIELLDFDTTLFADSTIAKAQLPALQNFEGWIAF